MKIEEMSIDLETRSSVDIGKCGAYKYAESPDFDILLFAVSVNSGPVTVYDLASGEQVPEEIVRAVADDGIIKYAFNASFERVCLSVWLRRKYPKIFHGYGLPDDPTQKYLNPISWRCTMVLSAYNGLPLSLAQVGAVLKLEQQKMKEGRDLIRYFCTPSRTSGRAFNLPEHAPEKWEVFKQYNKRDVETEMAIKERLKGYPVPDCIWDEYHLDQEINDRGIMIDRILVCQAIRMDETSRENLMTEMKEKTGLDNPNSVQQMKGFLTDNGMEVESLGKKEVAAMIKDAPEDIAEVLSLRLQLAKSSVKKYQAMENAVCADSRCPACSSFTERTVVAAGRDGMCSCKISPRITCRISSKPEGW